MQPKKYTKMQPEQFVYKLKDKKTKGRRIKKNTSKAEKSGKVLLGEAMRNFK